MLDLNEHYMETYGLTNNGKVAYMRIYDDLVIGIYDMQQSINKYEVDMANPNTPDMKYLEYLSDYRSEMVILGNIRNNILNAFLFGPAHVLEKDVVNQQYYIVLEALELQKKQCCKCPNNNIYRVADYDDSDMVACQFGQKVECTKEEKLFEKGTIYNFIICNRNENYLNDTIYKNQGEGNIKGGFCMCQNGAVLAVGSAIGVQGVNLAELPGEEDQKLMCKNG